MFQTMRFGSQLMKFRLIQTIWSMYWEEEILE